MIAALFVETNGCYFGLPGVDPWDRPRDARLYAGPHPVVAHPPCERWGRYWGGAPATWPRLLLGDDGGCFASAQQLVDVQEQAATPIPFRDLLLSIAMTAQASAAA